VPAHLGRTLLGYGADGIAGALGGVAVIAFFSVVAEAVLLA
jgi:hypothetical protein